MFCCFLLFCPLSPIFSRSVFSNDDEDDADETNDTFYHHPTLPLFLTLDFESLSSRARITTRGLSTVSSVLRAQTSQAVQNFPKFLPQEGLAARRRERKTKTQVREETNERR